MASSYENDLRLNEMGTGDASGTWGTTTNTNLNLICDAFGYGTEAITTNADTHSTTIADGSADAGRAMFLKYTGTLDSTCTVSLLPNTTSKVWIIENATSGGYNLSIKQGSGAEIVIPNGDIKIVYSDGAGSGAAIYDALVDLNIATKLTLKNPATSSSPATLLLQSGDTDVAADDVLGKIQFQAPDEGTGTDAILVAAEVAAISEGDFSSSSNATKLSFKTGASEAATEKMSISSVGNVTMKQTATGDDTPMTLLLQTGETDIAADDVLGKIQFQAPDEGAGTDAILVAAEIAAISEGDFSASSNATKLSFKTGSSEAATEKMSLSSSGTLTLDHDAAGASAAPILTLNRTSDSPADNDIGGQIQFDMENDNNEQFKAGVIYSKATDVSDGTEDGEIRFKAIVAGTETDSFKVVGGALLPTSDDAKLLGADANYTDSGHGTLKWLRVHADRFVGGGGTTFPTATAGIVLGIVGAGTEYGISIRTGASTMTAMTFQTSVGTVGSISCSGSATSFATSSDYRLKENVTDMIGAITRVKNLKPKRFNFKIDSSTTVDGFLAHEASEIVPEAVTGEKDAMKDGEIDPQGIDQSKLVPLLTGALQEAIAKIEVLESKVAALENG